MFFQRKWRERVSRSSFGGVTLTKYCKNAVGRRAPVARGKWTMATGRGGNPEEKLGIWRQGGQRGAKGEAKGSMEATKGAKEGPEGPQGQHQRDQKGTKGCQLWFCCFFI